MKPRLWASIVIFASAYAPLGILFAIRDFDEGSKSLKHPSLTVAILVTFLVSVLLLLLIFRRFQGQHTVKVVKVDLRSNDLMNYSIPYVVSFFSVDFAKLQDIAAFGFFMGLLFMLTAKTQSLFINPVLAMLGYGLFDVEFEESQQTKVGIFLTQLTLQPGTNYRVERLSQFLFVATTKAEQ